MESGRSRQRMGAENKKVEGVGRKEQNVMGRYWMKTVNIFHNAFI